MDKHYELAVIGGGAAGFAAAITAAESVKTVIIEGGARTGRKLAASGNGQGNIANACVAPENYNCSLPFEVFDKVPYSEVQKFFTFAGIQTTQKERGRIYPLSLQASSVVDNLRLRAAELNIDEVCNFKVNKIDKKDSIFIIKSESGGSITAKSVIISCGGRAHPNLSCGGGYGLLTAFGHKITPLLPSLVQLKTEKKPYLRHLKGVRLTGVSVKAVSGSATLKAAEGDVIFTDYGVSGSAVFEVSGYAVKALDKGESVTLIIDLMPDIDIQTLSNNLFDRKNALGIRAAGNFLTGFAPKQFASAVYEIAGIDTEKPLKDISASGVKAIADGIKNFSLAVTGSLGFDSAQVTMGGIDINGFDRCLMSKYCDKLYACGEVLDVDGDCGGFNLLWAFSSGILCGREAAKRIKEKNRSSKDN